MERMRNLCQRIGRAVATPTMRGVWKRLVLFLMLLCLTPQLTALWRIALYGEATQQGILMGCIIILAAVVSMTRWVRRTRKDEHGGSKAVDRPAVADKAVQRRGKTMGGTARKDGKPRPRRRGKRKA